MTNLKNIAWNRMAPASILLMLAMVAATVACSTTDSEEDRTVPPAATMTPRDTPVPTVTPVPTPIPTPEPASTPEPTSEPYLLEIVDMLGRTVEIKTRPARIVSISPTSTEMLYVAGGTAVARDSSSTFPAEVVDLPELGGAYSPSFEAIAAQRADLILIEALTQGRFLEPLSQLGAPVVAVRATSLDDVTMGIKLIGQIIESTETAEQAAQEISSRVTSSAEGLSEGKSILILISDADRNLYAAKPQSYPGAIASMLKLSNPAAELPDSGTFPGFAGISAEQILTMDPDFVFTITPAPEPAPRLSAVLPRIPGFSNLQAVTSGQMHEIDHVIFLRNPGPRISVAVEAMAELVGGSP
ncbi:MAG: ABC transporter substrate-binding protein [Dehalococcoidia bacterium]|nr:ABC transporter substrate-binding protein [Dehalococcoidia bacterium]